MDQQQSAAKAPLFEVKNGIGRATFNRPQARNAFTFEMYERLAQICGQASGE
jgi:enoyl-CoA hydratase